MKIICKAGGFYHTEIITDSGVELHKELQITNAKVIPAYDSKGRPQHWKLCLDIMLTEAEIELQEGQTLKDLEARLKILTPNLNVEVEDE